MGETYCERAGILNLGIEGTMYAGAFFGFLVAESTGSLLLGLAAAIGCGLGAGLLMGALTVTFGANQHVSGLGLTLFLIGARRCVDPATEKGYDVRVDNEHGLITLRRDRDRAEEALPRALIPASPIPDTEQRRSIERFARAYLAGTASPALTEVLERRPPRRTSRASPSAAARSRPRATRTPASRASSSTRATAGRRCSTRSCSSSPGRPGSSHGRTSPGFCDTLIVDEAGQIALADVVAVGHVARNLVFLGDPNQLPQVAQGMQPVQAKASVLQHLLGEETTVPPDRGIFLAETWRLRPELAAFTSDAYYAGRLDYAADRRRRPRRHALQRAGAVPAGARARRRSRRHRGQVPGAGGAVVLVSLAGSSAEDAARGLGFVFNRNRIKVATSRAQYRVELVCSPRLLEADCKTVEQLQLVNALCRFGELSTQTC